MRLALLPGGTPRTPGAGAGLRRTVRRMVLVCCLGLCGLAAAACQPDEPEFDRVKQSVVRVIADYGLETDRTRSEGRATGSGFVVNDAGCIVTNYHVVQRTMAFEEASGKKNGPFVLREIKVLLAEGDRILKATIVATDLRRDLAVLRVNAPVPLRPLVLAPPGTTRDGETVWGIGFPGGADVSSDAFLKSKLSRGIVSAVIVSEDHVTYVQTDAGINSGNSGGPLVDRQGRVVGVNTMKSWKADQVGWSVSSGELAAFLREQGIAFMEQGNASWRLHLALGLLLSGLALSGAALFFLYGRKGRLVLAPAALRFPFFRAPDAAGELPLLAANLTIRKGEGLGQSIPLSRGTLLIGRDPATAQLVFRSKKISRLHARIIWDGGPQATLEDLSSTNGIWCEGRRVRRSVRLFPGMQFALAQNEVVLSFEINGAATPPTGRRDQPWRT